MSTPTFHGIVPPLVTPLTADGELDLASFERLVNRQLEGGVHGLFVLGSSGEVGYLDAAQRDTVLRAAVHLAGGSVPVLAGVCETSTRRVVAEIGSAVAAGVDAVVATAPFYVRTDDAGIERHFRAIGAASTVPVFAYDVPVRVHVKLDTDMLVRLGVDGALAGVKDSSGDDVSFRRLLAANRAAGSPLALFSGHEVVVDGAFLWGADGAVPGLANVDPAGYVRLWDAAQAGDWAAARAEQERLAALFEIVFQPVGMGGDAVGLGAFKTALRAIGTIDTNVMCAPCPVVTGPAVDAIQDIVKAAGLLV
ncbi:MAG TPA: dihydrodipicolinate synthase family protein [Cellulomonas sp.]